MGINWISDFYLILAIALSIFAYQLGKRTGRSEAKQWLIDAIRENIEKTIIKPWQDKFAEDFLRKTEKAYEVGSPLINFCFLLAKELYSLRWIFPDDKIFEKRKGISCADFICAGANSDWLPNHESLIDPYFGSPLGYVDALLYIILKDKKLPHEVWLNVKTGELTDTPSKSNEYEHILLGTDDSAKNYL